MEIYFDTNQFPALPYCGPRPNNHRARGFINHYRLSFYPKLVLGICAIRRIPCACVACTSMLEKPWISVIPSKKQARYQPVTDFTYWTAFGSYNNWNIIELSHKSTHFEAFDNIYKVVLDGIS